LSDQIPILEASNQTRPQLPLGKVGELLHVSYDTLDGMYPGWRFEIEIIVLIGIPSKIFFPGGVFVFILS
jgi:hypothetical protein